MKYVYIDESGETGRRSKYIVLVSVSTTEHRRLEKAIKKIWQVKPALHSHGELHAYNADEATRRRVLQTLNELPLSVDYLVIDKAHVSVPFEEVYYAELARLVSYHSAAQVIVIDRKDTFKKRQQMLQKLNLIDIFRAVSFEDSYRVRGLQATDFIAWALGRQLEFHDNSYADLISRKNRL